MSFWQPAEPLLLASRSTVRLSILRGAGLLVEAGPVDLDERGVEDAARRAGAGPDDVAHVLAREKALAASALAPDRIVVGADQTLAAAGEIFHKPVDLDAARAQLLRLSGRTHALHAAVAVVREEEVLFQHLGNATLTMRSLSERDVEAYLAHAGPQVLGSVGVYQIEGPGVQLFESIEGDHFTIMGLPLLPLLSFFRAEGWVL